MSPLPESLRLRIIAFALAPALVGCALWATLGGGGGETVAPGPDWAPAGKPPELDEVRSTGAKIRPLFSKKRAPRPGDWLAQHREDGQTFEQYLRADPNRPTARRAVLYIQPIGDFSPVQQKLIEHTADAMGRFFGLPVKTLKPIGLDVVPASARRTRAQPQILSTWVLDMLKPKRPADAVAVLALTNVDLWPGENWNFVFGQASLSERVGVWSVWRFGDPERDYTRVLRRTLQTATHETGHMFGIQHCIAFECGMNGSNNLPEADATPMPFCSECEMKLWWACRIEPARRYAELIDFAEKNGLRQEFEFWRKCADAIK